MVWETFCNVFIWVVVIQFYPKSCNFKGVYSLFSEKSCKFAKQDITWRNKDMKIEDLWFLKGLWRQYKVKNIHFKYQVIARWKNAKKLDENCIIHKGKAARSALAPMPSAPASHFMCPSHGVQEGSDDFLHTLLFIHKVNGTRQGSSIRASR